MNRLCKRLASSLAVTLVCTMLLGMVAMAEENPSVNTKDPDITDQVLEEAAKAIQAPEGVTVASASVSAVNAAKEKVEKDLKGDIADKLDVAEVQEIVPVTAFDLHGTPGKITLLNVPGVEQGGRYVMLHQKGATEWEVLPVTVNSNGSITFEVESFSFFQLLRATQVVEKDDGDDSSPAPAAAAAVTASGAPASPKTGEALPAAGIITMICLAGAAVCVRKVRYNRNF